MTQPWKTLPFDLPCHWLGTLKAIGISQWPEEKPVAKLTYNIRGQLCFFLVVSWDYWENCPQVLEHPATHLLVHAWPLPRLLPENSHIAVTCATFLSLFVFSSLPPPSPPSLFSSLFLSSALFLSFLNEPHMHRIALIICLTLWFSLWSVSLWIPTRTLSCFI